MSRQDLPRHSTLRHTKLRHTHATLDLSRHNIPHKSTQKYNNLRADTLHANRLRVDCRSYHSHMHGTPRTTHQATSWCCMVCQATEWHCTSHQVTTCPDLPQIIRIILHKGLFDASILSAFRTLLRERSLEVDKLLKQHFFV